MNDEDIDNGLTPEEARRLESLRGAPRPPAALARRTVEQLRGRGLVASKRPTARRWLTAAAAAALFAAGVLSGWLVRPSAEPGQRYGYLLLLTEEEEKESEAEAGGGGGGVDTGEQVSEYASWARALREDGVEISGARLSHDHRVVGAAIEPPSISGFFLLDAVDEEHALEIARSCPHTGYGGAIVVGRILR